MFIELHDGATNNRVLVNADDISVVVDLPDVERKTLLVLSGSLDTWRYVRESYDDIVFLLNCGRETVVRKEDIPSISDLLSRLGVGREEGTE